VPQALERLVAARLEELQAQGRPEQVLV